MDEAKINKSNEYGRDGSKGKNIFSGKLWKEKDSFTYC